MIAGSCFYKSPIGVEKRLTVFEKRTPGPRYSHFLRNLPNNTTYFCAVYDYVEKADHYKGYQNPKRKLG